MKQPCAFRAIDGWWYPGYFEKFDEVETVEGPAIAKIMDVGEEEHYVEMGRFVLCDSIEIAERMSYQFDEEIERGLN